MIRDNVFRELLAKTFGAQIVSIDADGYFEVVSFKELPTDLAQMSIKLTVTTQNDPIITVNGYGHHTYGPTRYDYWFHPAAEDKFAKVLTNELEKKRYKEFSQTFDEEVQSELEQRHE